MTTYKRKVFQYDLLREHEEELTTHEVNLFLHQLDPTQIISINEVCGGMDWYRIVIWYRDKE